METKTFKNSEEFVVACSTLGCDDIYGFRNCGECYFQAGQSFPNDKIKRALEVLKNPNYIDVVLEEGTIPIRNWDESIANAIKILECSNDM